MGLPRVRTLRVVTAFYIGLAVGYLGLVLLLFLQGETWRADFTNYYTGAVLIREGHGASLYDPHLQARRQQEILSARHLADGLLPYNHPPHLALFLTPLTLLPLETAYGVWVILNVVLWAGFLWDVGRFARRWGSTAQWLAIGIVAALPGVLVSLALGATTVLSTGAIWGFYRALKAQRAGSAILWLALASVRPQAILFPLLILVGGRQWRVLSGIAIVGILLVFLCGLVLGWAVWPGFIEMIRQTAEAFGYRYMVAPQFMVNLKAVLTLLLGEAHSQTINFVTAIGLILAALFTVRIWLFSPWQPEEPDWELRVSLSLSLGLFFNPHAHHQDGLMIAVPGLLFYTYLRAARLPARAFAVTAGIFPFLWFPDVFLWWSSPVSLFGILIMTAWAIFTFYSPKTTHDQ